MAMTKRDYVQLLGHGVNVYVPERLLVGLGLDEEIPFEQMTDKERLEEQAFNALETAAYRAHQTRISRSRGPGHRYP